MGIYMILTCIIILRFITPSHLCYFLIDFDVTSFPAGIINYFCHALVTMRVLPMWYFLCNVLILRCDALRTLEFNISVEFFPPPNGRLPLSTRTILTVVH